MIINQHVNTNNVEAERAYDLIVMKAELFFFFILLMKSVSQQNMVYTVLFV